jgi:hypothetical protein
MNPAMLYGGLAALSPALGHLFGGGGPDYKQLIAMLQKNFGVDALKGDTQKMYQLGLSSPGFQNQLQGINLAGNQFNQNYAAGQAAQGFGGDSARSGVGQVGSAAAPAMSSKHRGQAYGDLYGRSQQLAMQNLLARLQAMQSMQPGMGSQDLTRQLFGGALSGFGQYLNLNALGGRTNQGPVQGPTRP